MKTFSKFHTEYDLILRSLWRDEVGHDEGLAPGDVGTNANHRMNRHNLLERARLEGWAETRYSGPRGGKRYHAARA